ncbi:MAG: hypothetical protein U5L09_00340 [Bacteroidales bacterium]|nr:hypothetical protein [Bacteroidales bacterium]
MAKITGFIGKPEYARKKRGEQYFFVNNRFIKHPYFHHAVNKAYTELLPEGYHPTYFIFFEVPADRLDVNIHPTKTEVNFQDGVPLYSMLVSVIKEGIGKFNLSPSIDFDIEQTMNLAPPKDPSQIKPPSIQVDPDYNPFQNNRGTQKQIDDFRQQRNRENWTQLYKLTAQQHATDDDSPTDGVPQTKVTADFNNSAPNEAMLLQVAGQYIASGIKSGLMLVDQHAAHERILYEKILNRLKNRRRGRSTTIVPAKCYFSAEDATLLKELPGELSVCRI